MEYFNCLNRNYIRFGVLVFVVISINILVYYSSKLLNPNLAYGKIVTDKSQQVHHRDLESLVTSATTKVEPAKVEATKPSVFCIIKTHPNNIAINKTLTVLKVWARKCDNYRFISLIPKSLLPSNNSKAATITLLKKPTENVELEISEPFYILQPPYHVKETHEKLTDKLYRAFQSVYHRFPGYDWYYVSDDDAYVNMNNLKNFLRDKDQSQPITFGFEFKVIVKDGYHSGGPGYAVSGEAFGRLVKKLDQNYTECKNTGTDDVDINDCLRMLGARMEPSIDEKGRQRWLCLGLMDFWAGNFPGWLLQYSVYPLKKGIECCSDSLIGVHYMSPRELIRLDIAIEVQQNILNLYDQYVKLNKNVTFGDILKNYMMLEDFEAGKTIKNN